MDPFIGQIVIFAGNFAPRGWALCDGQLLNVSSNPALFSILGATYGGDGKKTFGLPDLRGRVPMHAGTGPGLTPRSLGQKAGEEGVHLTEQQLASHSHEVNCSAKQGTLATPVGNFIGGDRTGADDLFSATKGGQMNAGMIEPAGSGDAHNNMQPFQVVNYIIALVGTYPSRS